MAIKNIVFDVGMVLADFRYTEYMRDLGFSDDVIKVLTDKVVLSELWDQFDLGIMEEAEIFRQMKERVPGYEKYVDTLLDYKNLEEIVWSYDYAADWLKEVRAKGYKVYLLSNYPERMFELHERTKFTFIPYIDGKVVSGCVKMSKPDPAIYKFLLDKYNLKADECIFFDDREKNIETAKKLGFHAYLFTDYENAKKLIP